MRRITLCGCLAAALIVAGRADSMPRAPARLSFTQMQYANAASSNSVAIVGLQVPALTWEVTVTGTAHRVYQVLEERYLTDHFRRVYSRLPFRVQGYGDRYFWSFTPAEDGLLQLSAARRAHANAFIIVTETDHELAH